MREIEYRARKALGKKVSRHPRRCDKATVRKKHPVGGEHVQMRIEVDQVAEGPHKMSFASCSTCSGGMPAAARYGTGSRPVFMLWFETVSILTVCPDRTRSTGGLFAAIQPQLTVSGLERKVASGTGRTDTGGIAAGVMAGPGFGSCPGAGAASNQVAVDPARGGKQPAVLVELGDHLRADR